VTRVRTLTFFAAVMLLAACTQAAETTTAPTTDTGTATTADTGTATTADSGAATTTTADTGTEPGDGLLADIQSRGSLLCGINETVPGFGFLNADGTRSGFDIDYCRAVAAAVLGDPEAVEYVPLDAQQRFTALSSGEIDVLIRNTTFTATRDGSEGATFLSTTFYDGQGDDGVRRLRRHGVGGSGQYRHLCVIRHNDRVEPRHPLRRYSLHPADLRGQRCPSTGVRLRAV
jgi:general L-amino acid transport system substrate-binding protein